MSVAVQNTLLLCHQNLSNEVEVKFFWPSEVQQVQTSESARCQSHKLIRRHV